MFSPFFSNLQLACVMSNHSATSRPTSRACVERFSASRQPSLGDYLDLNKEYISVSYLKEKIIGRRLNMKDSNLTTV